MPQNAPLYGRAAAQQEDQIVTLPADAYLRKGCNLAAFDGSSTAFIVPACSMPHASFLTIGKVGPAASLTFPHMCLGRGSNGTCAAIADNDVLNKPVPAGNSCARWTICLAGATVCSMSR